MTLNKLFGKLKSQNKSEYRQVQFCLVMAVLLITSYVEILFSPLVQNTLPEGGDSGKQIYLIFGIAVIGCAVFAVYAVGLFLRYKSREVGVFLALGTEKGKMARALMAEMSKITCICSVIGILLGSVLGFGVGKCFEGIAGKASDSHFAFTAVSILSALLFCLTLYLCIVVLSVRFMKRTDIMEIVNEQRKQEPLKKMVKNSYLWSGILLSVAGLAGGYLIPALSAIIFRHWLGAWTNLFYLLVVAGIYRIMVYSIAVHKRGSRPQKYYNNMISYGMLKFQGASIVRNMLVIALLLIGGLFAAFYVPGNLVGKSEDFDNYEADYSYRYPENADEVSKNDLEEIGGKYQIGIENYREAEFIQVVGNGVNRDDLDENGNLMELNFDEYAVYDCISVSGYYNLTGKQLEVLNGQYLMIQRKDAYENVYNRFDDMNKLYDGNNQSALTMKYMGIEVCESLVEESGFDSNSRFIISDEDYEILKTGLSENQFIKQVFFDTVENENTILFANELYKEYCLRASEDMKIMLYYDPCEEKRAGADYGYAGGAVFDPYNTVRETDWQYKPVFVYLDSGNFMMTYAVRFLLFIYVSIICLAAVGVISYTRSKSIAIRNRQVFADLEKLGSNDMYLRRLLKKQIQKIFVLPTAVGCGIITAFEALIRWQNDGRFNANDWKVMIITVLGGLAVVIYQYAIYRLSMKATTKMLDIKA